VMYDGVPYDLIQRQRHGACEVPKIALFQSLSPPPFTMAVGN